MSGHQKQPEFRLYYFTHLYAETVAFYRDVMQLEIFNSWDRSDLEKGTIFRSPNGAGLIEIEAGTALPGQVNGGLYIQVKNVDWWYEHLVQNSVKIVQPLSDTSYGHRNFKFEDPSGWAIVLFDYL